jgi:hypothetical protein
MSEPAGVIPTEVGPLTVRPLAHDTLQALARLFPKVGWYEDQGHRLLALLPVDGERVLHGLRTAYGWFPPEERQAVEGMFDMERLVIIEAIAAFRRRGFRGVLVPAACMSVSDDGRSQLGELFFLRAQGRLANGDAPNETVWDERFGEGATDVLVSLIRHVVTVWHTLRAAGVMTDFEVCPANWASARWQADLALVDDRVVVITPRLTADHPILEALVRHGITEVEHTPSVFVIERAAAPTG